MMIDEVITIQSNILLLLLLLLLLFIGNRPETLNFLRLKSGKLLIKRKKPYLMLVE